MLRAASRPSVFFILASAVRLQRSLGASATPSLIRSQPTLLDENREQQHNLKHFTRAADSHWRQKHSGSRKPNMEIDPAEQEGGTSEGWGAPADATEFDGFCSGSKDYPVHARKNDSKRCGELIYRNHGRNYFSTTDLCVFSSEIEGAMIDCLEGYTCVGLIRMASARGNEFIAVNKNVARKYFYKCDASIDTGTLAEISQTRNSWKASSKSTWCRVDSDFAVSLPFNNEYGCDPSHKDRCSWNISLADAKAKCRNITDCNGIIASAEYLEEDDEPEPYTGSWVAYTSTATYDAYYPDDAALEDMRNGTKKAVIQEYAGRYEPCKISSLERIGNTNNNMKGDDNIPVTFDYGARKSLPTFLIGVLVSSSSFWLL